MNKGGRPRDPIWEFYVPEEDGKKSTARCKICNSTQSVKVYRMKAHYNKCSQNSQPTFTTQFSQRDVGSDSDSKASSLDAGVKRSAEPESVESPQPKKIRPDSSIMSAFVTKTSPALKDSLDDKVARFFYSCNIPFSAVDHPSFQDLAESLRPGYKPPTRKALAGSLLDSVFDKLHGDVTQELEGKVVTLVEDGWSTVHNDPVVATSLATGGKSYFLDAHDTGSMKKTMSSYKCSL